MTFHGTLAELQDLLHNLEVTCHWEHMGPFEMAVIDDGVSNLRLHWWPATGELQLTGEPAQREPLLTRLQTAL